MACEGMYVLSTGHLTETAYKVVDAMADMRRDEGCLIFCGNREAVAALVAVHEDLRRLCGIAEEAGCSWLMFDRDEPLLANTNAYDW